MSKYKFKETDPETKKQPSVILKPLPKTISVRNIVADNQNPSKQFRSKNMRFKFNVPVINKSKFTGVGKGDQSPPPPLIRNKKTQQPIFSSLKRRPSEQISIVVDSQALQTSERASYTIRE